MNIYVVTNNNFMLEGLKCMFSDNSLSVNRVLFSRITEIAFSNSDVVIVESELKTCDAGRVKHPPPHFTSQSHLFIKTAVRNEGGRSRSGIH